MKKRNLLNSKNNKQRNGKIDFLKFIFSVIVVIFHSGYSIECDEKIFTRGYMAVEFFFIVTGFLFAKSMSKFDNEKEIDVIENSLDFMKRKILLFYPYYLFVILVTISIWKPLYFKSSFNDWFWELVKEIPYFLLLHIFGFTAAYNWLHFAWYLSAMIFVLFVLSPIMIKYRKAYCCYVAPLVSLLLFGIIYNNANNFNLHTQWKNFVCLGTLRAFAEISLGCVCFAIFESGIINRYSRKFLIVAEVFCYFSYIYYSLGLNGETEKRMEISLILILALGITISFSDKSKLNFLNNKFVYFLGKLSLPLYLCHSIVRFSFRDRETKWEYSYTSYLIVFLTLSIILSLICMFLVDGIKKRTKKR